MRRKGFSFFVEDSGGEERVKPLRAWEMLPVDEVQDRPKVDVEYLPAVAAEPRAVEPRPKRAPKVKVEQQEAVLPNRVKKERGVVVVERVDGHRRVKGKLEFLTKYSGFPTPSRQPLANFYVVVRGEKVLESARCRLVAPPTLPRTLALGCKSAHRHMSKRSSCDLELYYSPFVLFRIQANWLWHTSGSSTRAQQTAREAIVFLESMAHIATTLASMAAILSPAAMASGLAPRLGPGRAIALALRSRFGAVGTRSSQRDAEVKKLRALTTNAARDQYCVVMGPKGVGEFDVASPARD